MLKNPPAMQETWFRFLGQEDLLEKGMATYSSILVWRIPWTIGLWGCKELDMTEQQTQTYKRVHTHTHTHTHTHKDHCSHLWQQGARST